MTTDILSSDELKSNDPEFWHQRVLAARKKGYLFQAVWETSWKEWVATIEIHRKVLSTFFGQVTRFSQMRAVRVLDAGCGIGTGIEMLPTDRGWQYVGIDFSEDLLNIAKESYPANQFIRTDLRQPLPFPDRSFDLCICRSVEGPIVEADGWATWRAVEKELLRVADLVLFLNLTVPEIYRVADAARDPSEFCRNAIRYSGGTLLFRPGQDDSCEIYDLFVEEDHRRQGIGGALIGMLRSRTTGTLFGFTRAENANALSFYKALGFTTIPVPGMYRGIDAEMFLLPWSSALYVRNNPILAGTSTAAKEDYPHLLR